MKPLGLIVYYWRFKVSRFCNWVYTQNEYYILFRKKDAKVDAHIYTRLLAATIC